MFHILNSFSTLNITFFLFTITFFNICNFLKMNIYFKTKKVIYIQGRGVYIYIYIYRHHQVLIFLSSMIHVKIVSISLCAKWYKRFHMRVYILGIKCQMLLTMSLRFKCCFLGKSMVIISLSRMIPFLSMCVCTYWKTNISVCW